jgi:hypothetical protein
VVLSRDVASPRLRRGLIAPVFDHRYFDFDSLAPKYGGSRRPKVTLPERQQITKIGLSRPSDHAAPFSTWSLSKLAEFLVTEEASMIRRYIRWRNRHARDSLR